MRYGHKLHPVQQKAILWHFRLGEPRLRYPSFYPPASVILKNPTDRLILRFLVLGIVVCGLYVFGTIALTTTSASVVGPI